MGDFNCVRFSNEKLGGNPITPKVFNTFIICVRFSNEKLSGNPIAPKVLNTFIICLSYCKLEDIKYVGPHLTWSNKEEGLEDIQGKLD